MNFRIRCVAIIFCLCGSTTLGQSSAAPPAVPPNVGDDVVLRYDPLAKTAVEIAADEIKVGHIYNRFHSGLNRRVYGLALPGGGFLYAMGEGSVQSAWRLDIRASLEQQRQELEAEAPRLATTIQMRGGEALARLEDGGHWTLVEDSTIPSVFDEETGRLWEWHGPRRTPVIHSFGYLWTRVDGRYVPAMMGPFSPFAVCQ